MSPAFTLSTRAKFRSLSNSVAFIDFVSGQKKILSPEGESGIIQKKSLFQRLDINVVLGLKDILSKWKLCVIISLALN